MTAATFSKWPLTKWFAASLLGGAVLTVASAVEGQTSDEFYDMKDSSMYVDNTDHDLQFFSPVDFDFENHPIGQSCGYFFNFDKLNWASTGERTFVGVDGGPTPGFVLSNHGSTNPWRLFDSGAQIIPDPNDPDGEPIPAPGQEIIIPAPLVPVGIQSSPPRATFAWGERYEIGYFNGVQGISVGVLDGPPVNQTELYGYGLTGQDDTVVDDDVGLPSPFPGGPQQGISPLGSVMVLFEIPILSPTPNDPFGEPITLMHGWLDVVDGVVVDDPPGDPLEDDSNDDGVLDGDGIADDIDHDGHFGPDGFDLEDPVFVPDSGIIGGTTPDYDDLVELPTSFQTLVVRNLTETQGIEIMGTYRLDNRHRMAKHQNNVVEFSYGARYLKLKDEFDVSGFGGVLGTSFWDTQIENNLVGPQVALKWMHQRNRIRWDWSGRCLFGYNIQNWEQTAAIGEDLIPGQPNHPLYLQPTWSKYGKQVNDFSPCVEMRVQASYQFTRAIAARLGYTATFIDNINRASQHVRYRLPEMGFRDGPTQEIFINGVNFGFEVVY